MDNIDLKKAYPEHYIVVKSIIDFIEIHKQGKGFITEFSEGFSCLEGYINSLENKEEAIKELINITKDINDCLFRMYLGVLEEKNKELDKKINEPQPKYKQHTFNSKEVGKIAGIKSKDTVNRYFNTGTIKAKKDGKGEWIVQRKDLAEYIGHDNF